MIARIHVDEVAVTQGNVYTWLMSSIVNLIDSFADSRTLSWAHLLIFHHYYACKSSRTRRKYRKHVPLRVKHIMISGKVCEERSNTFIERLYVL